MDEIIWQDPKPTPRVTKWSKVTRELKANPGKWALVAENAAVGLALYLVNRYGLEATTRTAARGYKRGRADIYARYPLGEE